MKKKIISIMLCTLVVIGLVGCTQQTTNISESKTEIQNEVKKDVFSNTKSLEYQGYNIVFPSYYESDNDIDLNDIDKSISLRPIDGDYDHEATITISYWGGSIEDSQDFKEFKQNIINNTDSDEEILESYDIDVGGYSCLYFSSFQDYSDKDDDPEDIIYDQWYAGGLVIYDPDKQDALIITILQPATSKVDCIEDFKNAITQTTKV